jgi:hypothetical protein
MSTWEHVPTGATHLRQGSTGEFVEMTTANGNTYRMNSSINPIWNSPDMRLAVHKLDRSDDYLIEKVEGGVGLLLFRVGQMNFVKLARKGTEEWNDAVDIMSGRSIQGY